MTGSSFCCCCLSLRQVRVLNVMTDDNYDNNDDNYDNDDVNHNDTFRPQWPVLFGLSFTVPLIWLQSVRCLLFVIVIFIIVIFIVVIVIVQERLGVGTGENFTNRGSVLQVSKFPQLSKQ